MKDKHRYDDLLQMPHPVSARHPQMPLANRAAQFSPFAALTGYEEQLQKALEEHCRKVSSWEE